MSFKVDKDPIDRATSQKMEFSKAGDDNKTKEPVKKVAREALDTLEVSLSRRFLNEIDRIWKVFTAEASAFFQRLSSLFSSSIQEVNPKIDTTKAQNHHITSLSRKLLSDQQLASSSQKMPPSDVALESREDRSLSEEEMSFLEASDADFASFEDEEEMQANDVDFESIENESSSLEKENPLQEVVSQSQSENLSLFQKINALTLSLEHLEGNVKQLKIKDYVDVKQALAYLDAIKANKKLIVDVRSKVSFFSVENGKILATSVKLMVVKEKLRQVIIAQRPQLESLIVSAVSDNDMLDCTAVLLRSKAEKKPKNLQIFIGMRALANNVRPPTQLINRGRNACYRNSVNQMLAIPFFQKPLLELYREGGIGKALVNLWVGQLFNSSSADLLKYDEALLDELRKAPGGLDLDYRYEQQDASEYLAIILRQFNYQLTSTKVFDGLDGKTSKAVEEEQSVLQISPFRTIEESISNFLHEKINDPKNKWQAPSGKSLEKYDIKTSINAEKPLDVIAVNVKRKMYDKNNGFSMNYAEMALPEDNIVDMSQAYNQSKGYARYELQGFVWNQSFKLNERGENSGHFIAYVNRNGDWYECNDEQVTKIDPKNAVFERRKGQFVLGLFVKVPEEVAKA